MTARTTLILVSPVLLVAGALHAQAPKNHQEMHRLHSDPKAYIAALEDPKRDAYQKPQEVMEALAVKEGEVIADIGSGSGYFTLRLARHVGDKGRVYAVDVNPDMVRHLNGKIRDLGVLNVSTILAPPDDPLLVPFAIWAIAVAAGWRSEAP